MFEKFATYDPNNPEDVAYMMGFRAKLAEHGVAWDDFLDYAEKTAFMGALGKSFKAMKKLPGAVGDWRKSRRMAGKMDTMAKNLGQEGSSRAARGREWANKELLQAGREALPAAGVTAAGAGGAAYAAGPADTTQNQMKQLSNRYLGTDFGMQSRLGAMLG